MAVPNHRATVTSVRAKYPDKPTADQCVELCNEVAWIHRAEGFGVGEKTGGTYGTRRDGRRCTTDGLVYKPPDGGVEQFVDILGNAQGSQPPYAVPSWQVYATSNRPWVAPIAPLTPPDPPDPPPNPSYVTKAEFDQFAKSVTLQLEQLRARDADLQSDLAGVSSDVGNLILRVSDLELRVEALEAGGAPAPSGDYVLEGDPTAPAVSTSRNSFPGHSHELRARVVKRPTATPKGPTA